MKITYFGHSCFKLETQNLSLLFDPFCDIGYSLSPTSADVTLCSHEHFDHNAVHLVNTKRVINDVIDANINGVKIDTLVAFHDEVKGKKRGINRIYKLRVDGFTIVHLGDLGEVSENVINFVKNADLLFIPVGGTYTIDAKQATSLIEKCSPKSAIPMHYKSQNSRLDISELSCFTNLYTQLNCLHSQIDFADLKDGINVMEISA